MTEKQGGSDLRANTTRAESLGDGWYVLNGHKWFCSAPMSDAFLTLAQAPGGLTCFLVPRFRRDQRRNGIHVMRLKDKVGDRANASSEIEYVDAEAAIIGEEGRGIRTLAGNGPSHAPRLRARARRLYADRVGAGALAHRAQKCLR